jgi:Cu(I)/Ag(I) efflux system membrane protein CusA/SilA
MVNQIIETALGGMNLTTTVEGRERYPIRVRYQRDLREHIEELARLPVVTHSGEVVPLEMLAKMQTTWGPGAINSEDARLVAHVSFSPADVIGDLEAAQVVENTIHQAQEDGKLGVPDGYVLKVVGTFEEQVVTNQRMWWLGPLLGVPPPDPDEPATYQFRKVLWNIPVGLIVLVAAINLFIIYLQFRNFPLALCVFAGIPVAFAGGAIFLAINDVQINTGVLVGFIALFGIAVDDGVVMATYLGQVFRRRELSTVEDIRNATVEAGRRRIRPCLMTTFTTIIALLPVLLSTGRGADVAKAMAWPVFGGMVLELLTLFVVPVVYCGFKELKMNMGLEDQDWQGEESTKIAI